MIQIDKSLIILEAYVSITPNKEDEKSLTIIVYNKSHSFELKENNLYTMSPV